MCTCTLCRMCNELRQVTTHYDIHASMALIVHECMFLISHPSSTCHNTQYILETFYTCNSMTALNILITKVVRNSDVQNTRTDRHKLSVADPYVVHYDLISSQNAVKGLRRLP